jgi:hypothetical protein
MSNTHNEAGQNFSSSLHLSNFIRKLESTNNESNINNKKRKFPEASNDDNEIKRRRLNEIVNKIKENNSKDSKKIDPNNQLIINDKSQEILPSEEDLVKKKLQKCIQDKKTLQEDVRQYLKKIICEIAEKNPSELTTSKILEVTGIDEQYWFKMSQLLSGHPSPGKLFGKLYINEKEIRHLYQKKRNEYKKTRLETKEEKIERIKEFKQNNPSYSILRIADKTFTCRRLISKILKEDDIKNVHQNKKKIGNPNQISGENNVKNVIIENQRKAFQKISENLKNLKEHSYDKKGDIYEELAKKWGNGVTSTYIQKIICSLKLEHKNIIKELIEKKITANTKIQKDEEILKALQNLKEHSYDKKGDIYEELAKKWGNGVTSTYIQNIICSFKLEHKNIIKELIEEKITANTKIQKDEEILKALQDLKKENSLYDSQYAIYEKLAARFKVKPEKIKKEINSPLCPQEEKKEIRELIAQIVQRSITQIIKQDFTINPNVYEVKNPEYIEEQSSNFLNTDNNYQNSFYEQYPNNQIVYDDSIQELPSQVIRNEGK